MAAKEFVNWMRPRSVYFDFREHRERGSICAISELFDFCISSWLLVAELIAGKGEDLKTLPFELLMELNHFFVVLVCQTSLGRHIDNHDTLLALED